MTPASASAADTLTTPRVLLRRPLPSDCAAFLDMVARSRRLHHPWIALPADRPKALRFIGGAWTERRRSFFVFTREGGAFVGGIDLSEIVYGLFRSAYVGYYGAAGQTGRGLMTEAFARTLDYAFGPLKLHRVEANIQPDNERSRALVQRCGFRLEGLSRGYLKIAGRWSDHERWAILRDEWRVARRRLAARA